MKKSRHALSNTEIYTFLFFSASLIGFIWEVVFTRIMHGEFYNRGFFYGPWLPLYGSGSILIYFFLHKKKKQPIVCFFLSGIIASTLELLTGLFQHALFGLRYWDYSGLPFNLGGYICLLSFLCFGFAGSFYITYAAPFLITKWSLLSTRPRQIILKLFILFFTMDFILAIFFPNKGPGITF